LAEFTKSLDKRSLGRRRGWE